MPPFGEDGATICVYLRWGLSCKFCAEGNCQARNGKPREKRPDVIQAMRDEDGAYKEWLEYKEECSGEPTGTADRKTTKQKGKKEKKSAELPAAMQSRFDKMEHRQKEADSQMYKLTRENRKLRKTLRSKSPHPSRRRKQASDSEEEEEDESERESSDSEESEDTEPMSSEEEEEAPPRRSKSRERGRSASRRTAKEKKPKGRSNRMMSVQRTDSEGEDSFEEKGGIEEDFASSEKLVVEIDHKYKGILERTRGVLLAKVGKLQEVADESAGDWFDETGSLGVENQLGPRGIK